MKGFTLLQAIMLLEANMVGNITMIQYEDGSGYKFNYSVDHGKPVFVDLTPLTEKEIIKANVIRSITIKF